jgi:phosphonopyruvate decarboxylase
MIDPKQLKKTLSNNNINQYIGVPDSVLKNFLGFIPEKNNFISNNEGSAVAYGIGYYLSTKKIPLIYMQNSGLGNAINPLISIAHKKVYSIPLLLLIGWRGSPNSNDEPQHQAQGKVTKEFLRLLGIKTFVLNNSKDLKKLKSLIQYSKKNSCPVAVLIKNGKIEKNSINKKIKKEKSNIKRITFLENLLKKISKKSKIISTTGYTSREIYQLRKQKNLKNDSDFYMIGGMGHTSNVALGYSKYSKRNVFVLDGDGSFLMHMGSMVNVGHLAGNNYKYILLNNCCHESVGSQKTLINKVNLKLLSKSLGFKKYIELKKTHEIDKKIKMVVNSKEKIFLNVMIKEGSIKNLTRPKKFLKIKENFIQN